MAEMRKPKILLVEADRPGAVGLGTVLESTTVAVRRAPDGVAGVDAALRHRPDVIVCAEEILPDGGLAFCRRVKNDPDLRCVHTIVVTDGADGVVRALDAGADDAVERPYRTDTLLARIRAGLRIQRLRRDLVDRQRTEALRTLAATLGHEVNNPLTALFGHLELTLRYVEQGDSVRVEHHLRRANEVAGRIGRVAHRLSHLVEPRRLTYLGENDMLDLSQEDEALEGYRTPA